MGLDREGVEWRPGHSNLSEPSIGAIHRSSIDDVGRGRGRRAAVDSGLFLAYERLFRINDPPPIGSVNHGDSLPTGRRIQCWGHFFFLHPSWAAGVGCLPCFMSVCRIRCRRLCRSELTAFFFVLAEICLDSFAYIQVDLSQNAYATHTHACVAPDGD